MKVLVSGSSGLIGTALVSSLAAGGHQVTRLVRRKARPGSAGEREWDPEGSSFDASGLDGLDAVVHLAGESIASRWTEKKKARIRASRVQGTKILCEGLARLQAPARVLVSASAIGYYGDRSDEILDEQSAPGADFLAEVCRAWEAATEPAARAGVRVVHLRNGIVLSSRGGALRQMLPPFKLGLGGRLGSGAQYMSFVALDDVVRIIQHAIATPSLSGPVNTVSPSPVRNAEFTKTLGKVLHRPTVLPVPAPIVRLLLGEMGEALLLSSARVRPAKLEGSGFRFLHPELEGALRSALAYAG